MKKRLTYEEYALKKEFRNLNLTKEQIALILRYFYAMAEFYMRIPITKVYEIICSQNEVIDEDEFYKLAEIVHEKNNFFFYILTEDEVFDETVKGNPRERDLLAETIVEFADDDYYPLIDSQKGKDFYVPEKEHFMMISDNNEPISQNIKEFQDFLVSELDISTEQAENIADDLTIDIRMSYNNIHEIFEVLGRRRISLTKGQIKKIIPITEKLINDTRSPYLCGHTPNEIPDSEKIKLNVNEVYDSIEESKERWESFMDNTPVELQKPIVKAEKPDRNAPCPCGSGKKYKKCCGLK